VAARGIMWGVHRWLAAALLGFSGIMPGVVPCIPFIVPPLGSGSHSRTAGVFGAPRGGGEGSTRIERYRVPVGEVVQRALEEVR